MSKKNQMHSWNFPRVHLRFLSGICRRLGENLKSSSQWRQGLKKVQAVDACTLCLKRTVLQVLLFGHGLGNQFGI